jgi:hypothetical protein
VEADTIADQIWMEAHGPRGARPQCSHWEYVKCTGHTKQKLCSHLHDGDMRDCLMLQEEWSPFTLESVTWDACGTTFRQLSNNCRVAVSMVCHNLWHTGVNHHQYYQEIRPYCMCHDQTEDWQYVLTCLLVDMALHRADSWVQLRNSLQR